jgi:hypothetical protein
MFATLLVVDVVSCVHRQGEDRYRELLPGRSVAHTCTSQAASALEVEGGVACLARGIDLSTLILAYLYPTRQLMDLAPAG